MADENGIFEIGGRLHKLPQPGRSLNVCLERGVFYTSAPDVARHAGPCCVLSPWLQGRPPLTLFVLPTTGEYVSASSGSRKREARPGPSSRFVSPPAVGAEGYFSPSAPHLGLCWGFLCSAVDISIILNVSDIERGDKAR